MITSKKIEEWLKEVQERPGSAPLIVEYLSNRLRDLTERNEELQNENIALLTGKRIEEYTQRIAHLEYQLELLKRQFGGELPTAPQPEVEPLPDLAQLLIYNSLGQVLRMEIGPDRLVNGAILGRFPGGWSEETGRSGEPPRLLVASASEEVLLSFTSGRIFTTSLSDIPLSAPVGEALDWQQAAVPDEPRGTEKLSCLTPISRLALADSLIQVSRRGFVKKIKSNMAQSILANRYIGTATRSPADRTFELVLCGSDDRLVLVSQEGFQLCLEVKSLPYAVDEGMRLANTDHLVAAFTPGTGNSILIVTQIGKLIHQTAQDLSCTASLKTRGEAVFSAQRRAQGVRVVNAAAVGENHWGVALHQDGQLSLHSVHELISAGAIPVQAELAAFYFFQPPIPVA